MGPFLAQAGREAREPSAQISFHDLVDPGGNGMAQVLEIRDEGLGRMERRSGGPGSAKGVTQPYIGSALLGKIPCRPGSPDHGCNHERQNQGRQEGLPTGGLPGIAFVCLPGGKGSGNRKS